MTFKNPNQSLEEQLIETLTADTQENLNPDQLFIIHQIFCHGISIEELLSEIKSFFIKEQIESIKKYAHQRTISLVEISHFTFDSESSN